MLFSLLSLYDSGSIGQPADTSSIKQNIALEIGAIVVFCILLIVLIYYRHKKNKAFREKLWKEESKAKMDAEKLKSSVDEQTSEVDKDKAKIGQVEVNEVAEAQPLTEEAKAIEESKTVKKKASSKKSKASDEVQ